LNLPIGILPGGSQNALCCDIGGKSPAQATIHILRGDTINADILKASFKKAKKEILCSIVTWGITGDIVNDSERY
jgi:diacylglycerol kinase family enzyme